MVAALPGRRRPVVGDDAAAATRGGVSLLVLQSVGRALGLGFVMVLTRHLDRGNVGRYSTVAAIVLFANFVADFGTSPAITRLVSRMPEEADRLLSRTVVPSLLFGVVVAVGVAGFGVAAYRGPAVADVAIGSLAIPAASMLSSVLGALDGAGLIARRALVTGLQTLVIASGIVPVVLGAGVRAPIVALAVAPWVALVAASAMARRAGLWRSRLRCDLGETRRLLRVALPFALSGGVSALVLRFDVIFLSLVRGPAETASYDLAIRLLEATTYLGTAVAGPLLFILSRRLGAEDREGAARAYGEAMRLLYTIGLPLSVGLVILARPLVATALGPGFAPVATPLAIMGAAQWLTFVIMVQGALVMGGDVIGRGIRVGLVNAAVTVVLDLVLVPRYGPLGAAAAMVASWVFAAATLDRFHRRTVGIATPLPSAGLIAATAAMALVLAFLHDAPIAVSGAAGAVVYVAAMFVTGVVGGGDVARLRHAVSRDA
jgi:O-antigen/teichoic acid export membrane protein